MPPPTPPWTAIILAAGEGTRMKSTLPKVLHQVAGRTLVGWVVDAALESARLGEEVALAFPGAGPLPTVRTEAPTTRDAPLDAFPAKVAIASRRIHKQSPRREGTE